MELRNFKEGDWLDYPICESKEPLVGDLKSDSTNWKVIVDGAHVEVFQSLISDDEENYYSLDFLSLAVAKFIARGFTVTNIRRHLKKLQFHKE